LNVEYFIAKRLLSAKGHKSSVSAPIIKIAVAKNLYDEVYDPK
jgi:lipoprotein-releasing system permease protein